MQKFYKTTIIVEVLSEDAPVEDASLSYIANEIVNGDWSGVYRTSSIQELTPKEAARELRAQGSDPGFFGLTEDGEEVKP